MLVEVDLLAEPEMQVLCGDVALGVAFLEWNLCPIVGAAGGAAWIVSEEVSARDFALEERKTFLMFGKSTLGMKAVSAVSIISWVCLTFCSMFESGKFSRPDSADWKLLTLSLALSWENLQSSPYVHLFLIQ